ncbi:hypothetical protein [Desnuesiella massiliensis]|uniref:hypothetical protein n=1 Tax=Desnuesiella massiliensis TaxID=1650662 RepID=UPI0006E2E17C|nr:hypothetical protein [Desnuesiella massiliensis]
MNCHENNKGNKGNHKHSPLKHMLHMILCCGLPIVIIGSLPLITRFSPNAVKVLGLIAPFLCPIMMISMIPMMFNHNKKSSCCDQSGNDSNKSLKLNEPIE